MMKAVVEYTLEVSDHDGYCSGGDCEYKKESKMYIIDVPDVLKDTPEGVLENPQEYDWSVHLPKPKLNNYGSGYCNISQKAQDAGLERHDYKITVTKVEIVQTKYVVDLLYHQSNADDDEVEEQENIC